MAGGFGIPQGNNSSNGNAVGVATANFQVLSQPSGGSTVRIVNNGSNFVFIAFGVDNTVVATLAGGICLLPNSVEYFDFGGPILWIASIAAATGNVLCAVAGQML